MFVYPHFTHCNFLCIVVNSEVEKWYLARLNWAHKAEMLYGYSVKFGETLFISMNWQYRANPRFPGQV